MGSGQRISNLLDRARRGDGEEDVGTGGIGLLWLYLPRAEQGAVRKDARGGQGSRQGAGRVQPCRASLGAAPVTTVTTVTTALGGFGNTTRWMDTRGSGLHTGPRQEAWVAGCCRQSQSCQSSQSSQSVQDAPLTPIGPAAPLLPLPHIPPNATPPTVKLYPPILPARRPTSAAPSRSTPSSASHPPFARRLLSLLGHYLAHRGATRPRP